MTVAKLTAVVMFSGGVVTFCLCLWSVHPALFGALIGGLVAAVGYVGILEEL